MNATGEVGLTERVPEELAGERFDRIAAELFDEFSRSRLQKWIDSGDLTADGKTLKVKDKLAAGTLLRLNAVLEEEGDWQAENIPLQVVHEDKAIIVLHKLAGLVVHPAAGNPGGTLLNGLLHAFPELKNLPRGGIVHRLDKDTSGLMVVARSLEAHHSLVKQLQERSVSRHYYALVKGVPVAGETIRTCFGRDPHHRLKMAVLARGKEAITHFRVAHKFSHHALLDVSLETGRTHQIRVHLAHRHFPIVGDPLYGGRARLPGQISESLRAALQNFPRQALHAYRLRLDHPLSGESCEWQIAIAEDMAELMERLDE